MADIDGVPFEEHNKTEEPTDENIPLDPVTPVGEGSTWEPTPLISFCLTLNNQPLALI